MYLDSIGEVYKEEGNRRAKEEGRVELTTPHFPQHVLPPQMHLDSRGLRWIPSKAVRRSRLTCDLFCTRWGKQGDGGSRSSDARLPAPLFAPPTCAARLRQLISSPLPFAETSHARIRDTSEQWFIHQACGRQKSLLSKGVLRRSGRPSLQQIVSSHSPCP
jgi:hypothetical protein